MKGIALGSMIILLTACGCCTNTGFVEYGQVSYRPVVVTTPVVTSAYVTTPVYYDPVTFIDDDPLDVTTTTIDYY